MKYRGSRAQNTTKWKGFLAAPKIEEPNFRACTPAQTVREGGPEEGRIGEERIFIVIRLQCKHAKFRGRGCRRRGSLTISVCKSTVFIVDAAPSEYWKAENEETNEAKD